MRCSSLSMIQYKDAEEPVQIKTGYKECCGTIVSVSSNKLIVKLLGIETLFFLKPLDNVKLILHLKEPFEIEGKIIRVIRDASSPAVSICVNRKDLRKWISLTETIVNNYQTKLKEINLAKTEENMYI